MALKGSAVIELTDTNTGQKEVIRHDNLVTNAINDILGTDPLNLRLDAGLELRSQLFPIVGKLIGGIVLFEDPLEENPTKYFAPGSNKIVGYSNMAVSPATDIRRGSLNQTESGELEDGTGYRFVFDFESSQGNGQISALALTSTHMGGGGYSSDVFEDHVSGYSMMYLSAAKTAFRAVGEEVFSAASREEARIASNILSIDIANNAAYSVVISAANKIQVYRFDLLTDSIGLLAATPFRSKSPELITTITTTEFLKALYSVLYLSFVDGGDGYIWGFSFSNNKQYGKTINWVRIRKEDWLFEEGTWTLPVNVYAGGKTTELDTNSTFCNVCWCLVHKGLAYFCLYDTYGVAIVDTENPADIIVLEADTNIIPYSDNSDGSCWFNVLGDAVYMSSAHIVNKVLYPGPTRKQNYYVSGLYSTARPNLRYGPMVFGFSGGSYANVCLRMYIDNSYLATINNLDTPVTKTADKTMKITYILREE